MYIIVVFRSRTETLTFAQILRSYRVRCSVINTPRQASVSCGISVKIDLQSVKVAKSVLYRRKFNTFAGFFKVVDYKGGVIVSPL